MQYPAYSECISQDLWDLSSIRLYVADSEAINHSDHSKFWERSQNFSPKVTVLFIRYQTCCDY